MIASNVTRDVLERAARTIGVRADINPTSASGRRHRVKLYPVVPPEAWQIGQRPRLCPVCGERVTIRGSAADGRYIGSCGDAAPPARWANGRRWPGERGDAPYQRTSASAFRNPNSRVHAVCWHGFRDYFRAVFEKQPDAHFYTAMDKWIGSDDFEARHRASGSRNIGSMYSPVAAASACRCQESGFTGGSIIRTLRQSDIQKCPHFIMMPEHYRSDGKCRCDDVSHTAMREWGYKWRGSAWR